MKFKRVWLSVAGAFALIAASALLVSDSSASSRTTVIYTFTNRDDGGGPSSGVIFDAARNAYGTTVGGGLFRHGTIYKLEPTPSGQWVETVLWNFGTGGDGRYPYGGLTSDGAGDLFGTASGGGRQGFCVGGCGIVFELTRTRFLVLYSFRYGSDGFVPFGPVVFDRLGNLYGETFGGGTQDRKSVV